MMATSAKKHSMKMISEKTIDSHAHTDCKTSAVAPRSMEPFQSISMRIPLGAIDPSPFNPRSHFDAEALEELAASIAEKGVLSEILVRPKSDSRYEIIYGERRWRASAMAQKKDIPAKIKEMTDEEAQDAAITENLLRSNLTPFEEAQTFLKLIEKRNMSVKEMCLRFGKSERYVRSRLTLNNLILPVVQMLDNREITLEIAIEFAKYDTAIQDRVFNDHFKTDGWYSWKGIAYKEFSRRLYREYMTKLDNYHFDKTECNACSQNTLNQVLFTDCGDCAGCRNHACLSEKNIAYLVERCVRLSEQDARLHFAVYTSDADKAAVDRLTNLGYEIREVQWNYNRFFNEEEMPEKPVAEDYEKPDEFTYALREYNDLLAKFTEETQKLEYDISEGKVRKYAAIRRNEIDIIYERIEEETVEEEGITRIIPENPANELIAKDKRNLGIRYEHITEDLKQVLRDADDDFPTSEITPREEQIFNYVLLSHISYRHKKRLGLDNVKADKLIEFSENIDPEQLTMLKRMVIMLYFSSLTESNRGEETVDIKLLTEFTRMHFPVRSEAILDRHKGIYDKRHAKIQQRIETLEREAERIRLLAAATVTVEGETVNAETGEIIDVAAEIVEDVPQNETAPGVSVESIILAETAIDTEEVPEAPKQSDAPVEDMPAEEPDEFLEPDEYDLPAEIVPDEEPDELTMPDEIEEPKQEEIILVEPWSEEEPDVEMDENMSETPVIKLNRKRRTTKKKAAKKAA